jgi:hypothetical protein
MLQNVQYTEAKNLQPSYKENGRCNGTSAGFSGLLCSEYNYVCL